MENKTSTIEKQANRKEDPITKYDGKRVRINGMVFVIRVSLGDRLMVSLDRIRVEDEEYNVSTFMHEEDFPNANETIKKEIRLVHKIADEIEATLPAEELEA